MLPAGFEPTISAVERPQNHPLDRADTGDPLTKIYYQNFKVYVRIPYIY